MKHIEIYESFDYINEGEGVPTLKDIEKLADRELIEGMFSDRKFTKSVKPVLSYYAVQDDPKKMHNSLGYALAVFDPSDNGSNNYYRGEVILHLDRFEKIVTSQQQAKFKTVYDAGSPIDDLIGEVKEAYNGVMNKVSKSELVQWLKEHGWKEKNRI
jgi:hypothetical protein